MILIYTHENRYLVHNIQNIVENTGIDTLLRNQFAAGGVGDLAPHQTWLELWVINDADRDKAIEAIDLSFLPVNNIEEGIQWVCGECKENNDISFEVCWQCLTPAPEPISKV